MAWRIVKQPDGLYARFSDVVEDFTHTDMTREEAITLCTSHMSETMAKAKVDRADLHPERWEECERTIQSRHGDDLTIYSYSPCADGWEVVRRIVDDHDDQTETIAMVNTETMAEWLVGKLEKEGSPETAWDSLSEEAIQLIADMVEHCMLCSVGVERYGKRNDKPTALRIELEKFVEVMNDQS